jgi:hypothetical protein
MKHLTDEELVESYYGGDAGWTGAHLQECGECAAALSALETDLASLRNGIVPERDENYAEQMWARVQAGLPPRSAASRRLLHLGLWRGLAYGALCATLVAGAFYGGRVYEQWQHHKMMLAGAKAQTPAAAPQPRIVVVVLGDHLDRSERLLVELKHADAESPELVNPLRDEARGLLAANRVFRDDAEKQGDPSLTEALSHLDTVLTELANGRGGLDAVALKRVRDEMNADGLLFEVRVLRSKNPHRTQAVRVFAKGGAA